MLAEFWAWLCRINRSWRHGQDVFQASDNRSVSGTGYASCCLNRHGGNYRKVAECPGRRIKGKAQHSRYHLAYEHAGSLCCCFYDNVRSLAAQALNNSRRTPWDLDRSSRKRQVLCLASRVRQQAVELMSRRGDFSLGCGRLQWRKRQWVRCGRWHSPNKAAVGQAWEAIKSWTIMNEQDTPRVGEGS